jgi:2-amino-4-hydroxy-6-hydroxymethyldihydropteridine diphosphokinase
MATPILIAIGSNRRHGVHGRPEAVVAAVMAAIMAAGLTVVARSRIRATAPMGPGGRRYANAAVLVDSALSLPEVLQRLQQIERDFGRRNGKRWGDRVVDLDIIGAGDSVLRGAGLQVPHPGAALRRFVLDPVCDIAPLWRHPLVKATARQLRARQMRPKARLHGGG